MQINHSLVIHKILQIMIYIIKNYLSKLNYKINYSYNKIKNLYK